MIQREFADKAKTFFEPGYNFIDLAVVGSWSTNEIDEFSGLARLFFIRVPVKSPAAARTFCTKGNPFVWRSKLAQLLLVRVRLKVAP